MSFISIEFCLFLLVTFVLYFSLPGKGQWICLLIASLLFYATWGIEYLLILVGETFIVWLAGIFIGRRGEKTCQKSVPEFEGKEGRSAIRERAKSTTRPVLWLAVLLLLSILIYAKIQVYLYHLSKFASVAGLWTRILAFFDACLTRLPESARLAGKARPALGALAIFAPLGISYYSMSLIGYLADVYRGKETAERNFFKLLLFSAYFPKVLEGPISSHKLLGQQLTRQHPFIYKRVCFGLQRMLLGFLKKLVLADRLALFVTQVYSNYSSCSGAVLLTGAVFSAFQLYFDFSGCMDIAIGVSESIGITLEENFSQPFSSGSAAEFWRRWHITLGKWMKDYVYFPIVIARPVVVTTRAIKKRFGQRAATMFPQILALAVVWLLTGLWHGTGKNYVVWGLYWGSLMILGIVFKSELSGLCRLLDICTESRAYHLFQQARTFCLFLISRIIVIPGDLKASGIILKRIVTDFRPWELFDGTLYEQQLSRVDFSLIAVGMVLFAWISQREKKESIRETIARQNLLVRWLVYYAAIFAVILFGIYGPGYDSSSFVYMKY